MTPLTQRIARATQPSTAKIAEAAGRSVLGLALSDDWRGAVSSIAEKIDEAERRRAEMVEQRRTLLLGDDEAALTRAENDLAAIDRDLARLRDARDLADERARRQEGSAAREAYARALAAWERGNEELAALAVRADAMAREAAEVFRKLAEMADRQAAECPVPLNGYPSDRPLGSGRVSNAVQTQLATAGLVWARRGLGLIPWREAEIPSAVSTVAAGIEWARHEILRAGTRRKSAA